jgi:hypothetical protein
LLSIAFGIFATYIGFEAVDPPSGAIKRLAHPFERLLTSSSRGGRPMALLTIKLLFALVGKPFALIREKLALIGEMLALIGMTFALVRDSITLVSELVSLICLSLLIG